jgi:hypothetical protein
VVAVGTPGIGQLVRARGQHWVVTDVQASDAPAESAAGRTLVSLQNVDDGGCGRELAVA